MQKHASHRPAAFEQKGMYVDTFVQLMGLYEMRLNMLRRAHAALPVTAVQCKYWMLWCWHQHQALAVCKEVGIRFVP